MKSRLLATLLLVTSAPLLAQGAAVPVEVPLEPVAAENIRYVNSTTGKIVTVPWATLDEAVKRAQLPNAEAFVQVRQKDDNGTLTLLPLGASYKKGTYQLLFRWNQYRTDYCNPANINAGRIRTGVALEIQAEIRSKKSGLNIANLGPLSVAADRGQVSGSILIRQIGLGNSSPTLGTYLQRFDLTREGVTKALEAIAVTKAVLENMNNKITPHYLSVTESTPGACATAAPPTGLRPMI